MTTTQISNSENTIDSRDVIARIEELEEHEQAVKDAQEAVRAAKEEVLELHDDTNAEGTPENISAAEKEVEEAEAELDSALVYFEPDDEEKELKALRALQEEAEGYAPDWRYGATLINRDYFVDYCKELLDDIGDLPKTLPAYIEDNINWQGVASDLEVDYTCVDFDGQEFLVR